MNSKRIHEDPFIKQPSNITLIPPGECIQKEILQFCNNWGKYSETKPVILLFPPGLNAVVLKNIKYQATLFNLAYINLKVEDDRMIGVCRIKNLLSSGDINESQPKSKIHLSVDQLPIEWIQVFSDDLHEKLAKIQNISTFTKRTDRNKSMYSSDNIIYNHRNIEKAKSFSALVKEMLLYQLMVYNDENSGTSSDPANIITINEPFNYIKWKDVPVEKNKIIDGTSHTENVRVQKAKLLAHILSQYCIHSLNVKTNSILSFTSLKVFNAYTSFIENTDKHINLIPIIIEWENRIEHEVHENYTKYYLNRSDENVDTEYVNVLTYTLNILPLLPRYMEQIHRYCGEKCDIVFTEENFTPYKSKFFGMEHILEVYDFPMRFSEKDLLIACVEQPASIKWCGSSHALLVMHTPEAANRALQHHYKSFKLRPLAEASATANIIACTCLLVTSVTNPQKSNKIITI